MPDKHKDIQQRKEELKQEIQELQKELDENIHEARDDLSTRLKPRNLIKEYPLTSVGLTFLVGCLLGGSGGDSSSSDQPERNETRKKRSSTSSSNGLESHLWSEIKRSASKKAVRLLMDYLDDIIASRSSSSPEK